MERIGHKEDKNPRMKNHIGKLSRLFAPCEFSAVKILFPKKVLATVFTIALAAGATGQAAAPASGPLTNRAERLEWFRDQGFGLFIHWSVDSQLGVVISHSLVGASDD